MAGDTIQKWKKNLDVKRFTFGHNNNNNIVFVTRQLRWYFTQFFPPVAWRDFIELLSNEREREKRRASTVSLAFEMKNAKKKCKKEWIRAKTSKFLHQCFAVSRINDSTENDSINAQIFTWFYNFFSRPCCCCYC